MICPQHTVQFYDDDVFLTEAVASFIKVGLQVNDTLIVMVTASHRTDLRKVLTPGELANPNLMFLDAVSLLADIMVEDRPNESRFMEVLGNRIQKAGHKGRVRVFGEMVAILWSTGKYQAAIRLAELWNTLQAAQPFSLFHAYPHSALTSKEASQSVLALYPADTEVRYQKQGVITRPRGLVAALVSLSSSLWSGVTACWYTLLE